MFKESPARGHNSSRAKVKLSKYKILCMIENYSYLYACQKLILVKNTLYLHSYLSTLRLYFPHQSGDFNHTVVCLDDINFNSFLSNKSYITIILQRLASTAKILSNPTVRARKVNL